MDFDQDAENSAIEQACRHYKRSIVSTYIWFNKSYQNMPEEKQKNVNKDAIDALSIYGNVDKSKVEYMDVKIAFKLCDHKVISNVCSSIERELRGESAKVIQNAAANIEHYWFKLREYLAAKFPEVYGVWNLDPLVEIRGEFGDSEENRNKSLQALQHYILLDTLTEEKPSKYEEFLTQRLKLVKTRYKNVFFYLAENMHLDLEDDKDCEK